MWQVLLESYYLSHWRGSRGKTTCLNDREKQTIYDYLNLYMDIYNHTYGIPTNSLWSINTFISNVCTNLGDDKLALHSSLVRISWPAQMCNKIILNHTKPFHWLDCLADPSIPKCIDFRFGIWAGDYYPQQTGVLHSWNPKESSIKTTWYDVPLATTPTTYTLGKPFWGIGI